MMRREDFPRPFFAHVVSMRIIAFYWATWATLDFLSKVINDQVSAIHPEMYYDAYRVAATLLAYLDTTQ